MSRAALLALAGTARSAVLPDGRRLRLVYRPIPDGHMRVRFGACRWTAGLARATGDVSLLAFAPPVMDQGETGACTGHAAAFGVTTTFAASGKPLPFVVSPKGAYVNGRRQDQIPNPDGSFPPLTDEGAYISSVTMAMRTWGVRAMGAQPTDGRYSDADPATINDEPTVDEMLAESRVIPVGERSILDCSSGRSVDDVIADIRTALAANMAVEYGTFVGSSFMNWDPSQPPVGAQDPNDPNGGGHAIGIVATHGGLPVTRNSWGIGWGDAGNIVLGPEFVKQITDITVYVAELEAP